MGKEDSYDKKQNHFIFYVVYEHFLYASLWK